MVSPNCTGCRMAWPWTWDLLLQTDPGHNYWWLGLELLYRRNITPSSVGKDIKSWWFIDFDRRSLVGTDKTTEKIKFLVRAMLVCLCVWLSTLVLWHRIIHFNMERLPLSLNIPTSTFFFPITLIKRFSNRSVLIILLPAGFLGATQKYMISQSGLF